MNVNVINGLAQQASAASSNSAQSSGGGLMGLLPMIVIFGVMIFFMWHGQKKEQKRRQQMIDGVKVGDRVLTIGGIYGEIVAVKDQAFIVQIAENTKIEIAKSAVSSVPAGEAAAK